MQLFEENATNFQVLSGLFSAASLDDAAWRARVTATATEIKAATRRLRLLEPPSCVLSLQAALNNAALQMDEAVDLIVAGIQPGQTDRLILAVPQIAAAGEAFKLVQSAMRSAECPLVVVRR